MILFDKWTIQAQGGVIARQYDNLTRTLTVMGDLPAGWDWSMLVESGGNLNIISLTPVDGGVGVTLTADMIPCAGYYRMQLRGTQGEAVRHTNIIRVYIPESLTGEGQWPDLPSEFGQIEERMQELAGQAQDSADAADTSAKAAAESAAAAQGAEESVAANAKAAQDAANAAQTSEGNAKTSETNAAKSAGDAQTSAGQAADSATQAKTAQGKAEAAQTAAETAQGKAETAAGTATQAAQGAVTSAGQASQSAQEAASAATAAQNAQEAAEKAQGQAEAQATAAAGSATAAQESAAAAAGSSSSASGSAQTAQTAAQNAQKFAETAQEARQGAQAAQQAIEDLEVSSETLEPDSPASVEKTVSPEGVVTLEFGIPKGQPGQEDVLELLETITVDDEETTRIVRNGTYQLKAVVCTVYLPLTNGDSGNMAMYVSSGLGPIGYASIPSTNASTSAKRVKFRFYRKAGEYFTEGVVFPNAEEELGGVTMYFREYATPKIVESLGPITFINIQKSNVARLPLGTEIKLYGVRA